MINLIDTIKLPFRKEKELFSSLYKILGFYPHHIDLYKQALSHSSLDLHGENGLRINNERLEFLGDAIIEAVTSDVVYRHFSRKREGFLTTTRSKLVQRTMLNKISEEIGLDKLLRTSGQRSSRGNNLGGNAFEAIVGAIYLDRGYDYCLWFLKRRILQSLVNIDKVAKKEVNFKSKLLEWAQRNRLQLAFNSPDPSPASGSGNQATFVTTVSIEGIDCGEGTGYSKKESQQKASRETLVMLNRESTRIADILQAKERRTAMEAQLVCVPPRVEPEEAKPARQRRRNSAPLRAAGAEDTPADKQKAGKEVSRARVKAARPPKVKATDDAAVGGAEAAATEAAPKPRRRRGNSGRGRAKAADAPKDTVSAPVDAAPAPRDNAPASGDAAPVSLPEAAASAAVDNAPRTADNASRPENSGVKREAPAAKREAPAARRENAGSKSDAPAAKRADNAKRRENADFSQDAPASKREENASRRDDRPTKSEDNVSRREDNVSRPANNVSRRDSEALRAESAAEERRTAAREAIVAEAEAKAFSEE